MDAVLHITNGDGAAGVMRQAEFDGDILPWRDVLHEGPVQAHLPLAELSHIRARFIADKGWGTFEEVAAAFAARDHLLQASADSDRVVLWFEHDLFDQLQLLQLLAWCAAHDRGKARLDLLCIGDFPGVADFGGLGELTSAQMASLRGRERPVTEAQLELGRIGFQAFGADDPERLAAFLRRDLSSLPFLRGALERLLQEYPWQADGLPRSRRQLLRAAPACDGDLGKMFRACAGMEEARYLGDRIFLDYAFELAEVPQPPLRFVDSVPSGQIPAAAWSHPVMLTAFGARLLAGAGDYIEANRINRWIGGVHLAQDRWRYDPALRTVRRPAQPG
jgi:hypothetical protein